jgi:hypothetical protein
MQRSVRLDRPQVVLDPCRPLRPVLAVFGGAARLALAWYLALYLALVGPLSCQLWAEGTHLTLEQWAYHELLEQAGLAEHHGGSGHPLPSEPVGPWPQAALAALPAGAPQLVAGTLLRNLLPDQLVGHAPWGAHWPLRLALGQRFEPLTPQPPIGPPLQPPEPPPRYRR